MSDVLAPHFGNDHSTITVGAQSIVHAQSIAHGHIGDHICEETEIS
jgi:hypothetical protein